MAGWCVLCPLLLAVGAVGNLLVVWILCGALRGAAGPTGRRLALSSDSSSCSIFLVALAVADLAYLHLHLLPRWLYDQFDYRLDSVHGFFCVTLKWLGPSLELMKPWLLVALAMVHALSLLLSDGVFSGLKKARKCVTGGAVACVVVVSLACNTHYVITAEVVNVSVMDDRPAYPARKNVNFCITDYYNDDDPYHAFVQHVWDSTLKHFLYIHLPFLTLLVLLLVVLGFQLRAGVCAASPPGPVRAPGAKEGSCEMGPVKPDPRPAAAKEEVVDDRSLSEDWPLQGVGASGEAARAGKEEETSDKQADESELKPHNRTHHDGLLHHAGRGDELFAASFRQISGKSLSAAVVALIVLYMLLEAPYSFWPFLCQPGGYIFSPPWTYTPSHETSAAVDSAVTCMAYVNSAVRVFVYIAVDSVFRVRVVNLLSCYRFASASVTFRSPE